MLNCGPRPAGPGDEVFSRQMALFDAVPGIYASAAEFFALDKLFRPDHYPGRPGPDVLRQVFRARQSRGVPLIIRAHPDPVSR
jgi:hypothetical protein